MSAAGRFAIVIPVYNHAETILSVIERARALSLPVWVIDDGSTDGTAECLQRVSGITVLRHEKNLGKGAAILTGFSALRGTADWVVTLDADGQHDPAEIPRFLAAFKAARPELIVGRRDFRRMPPVRRLSNTVGGLILSAAVGRSIPDNQSGYRLVGRRLMSTLLASEEDGFAFEVEMIARCIALDLAIAWVPIRTIYAGEPSHIRPWAHFTSFVGAARDARRIVRGG